ncbi:hypothetical protein [Deinococcus frigens]|uniref:hypothetical protein n=1 Tax=Deinococcus frigens TaxID=249403 RepID=UPI000497C34B|nr:hypothetical protein [Deinococcus frigens]
MTASSTDILFSYGAAFPWQVFVVGALLFVLAFAFRRKRRAAYAFLTCGAACMIGAALLWAGIFQGQM